MSVDQTALSCVASSVTVTNAETTAKSMLSVWKGLCTNWNQETADAVGKAAINHAVLWNNAVMPEIDARIEKLHAEYQEQADQYEIVYQQYKEAERAVKEARDAQEACKDYPSQKLTGAFSGMSSAPSTSAKKVVVDEYGYQQAKKREAEARAESNRYKGQVDSWKKRMSSTDSNLSEAKKEKQTLVNEIEKFILGVYDLNLMNESITFLSDVKNSQIDLQSATKNKLFSRLFLIQNEYRKEFEVFENTLKNAGEIYKSSFISTPEGLEYKAERNLRAKKFKGMILVTLISKDTSTALLDYSSQSEFIIPTKNVDGAKEKIQALCKNFELIVDRNSFKIKLDKNYENSTIKEEVAQVLSHCDEYITEYSSLLDAFLENGASASKVKILFGKISNHFAHAKEKKDAYKKMTPEERKAAKAAEKQKKKEAAAEKKAKKVTKTSGTSFAEKAPKKNKLLFSIILWIVLMLVAFISIKLKK